MGVGLGHLPEISSAVPTADVSLATAQQYAVEYEFKEEILEPLIHLSKTSKVKRKYVEASEGLDTAIKDELLRVYREGRAELYDSRGAPQYVPMFDFLVRDIAPSIGTILKNLGLMQSYKRDVYLEVLKGCKTYKYPHNIIPADLNTEHFKTCEISETTIQVIPHKHERLSSLEKFGFSKTNFEKYLNGRMWNHVLGVDERLKERLMQGLKEEGRYYHRHDHFPGWVGYIGTAIYHDIEGESVYLVDNIQSDIVSTLPEELQEAIDGWAAILAEHAGRVARDLDVDKIAIVTTRDKRASAHEIKRIPLKAKNYDKLPKILGFERERLELFNPIFTFNARPNVGTHGIRNTFWVKTLQ